MHFSATLIFPIQSRLLTCLAAQCPPSCEALQESKAHKLKTSSGSPLSQGGHLGRFKQSVVGQLLLKEGDSNANVSSL